MSELICFAALWLIYPFMVLIVAITGPHSDAERAWNTRTKGQDSE